MRGFMRAIGLGGLIKNTAESASRSAKNTSSRGNSRRTARGTLLAVDEITLLKPDQAMLARSRESSVNERPQFLFFCGSDTSAVTAAARRTGDFSFDKAEVQARASLKSSKIETPMISHRMPVFFNPQNAMLHQME